MTKKAKAKTQIEETVEVEFPDGRIKVLKAGKIYVGLPASVLKQIRGAQVEDDD